MKHKTSELTGVLLDEAVAKALGIEYFMGDDCTIQDRPRVHVPIRSLLSSREFRPSCSWADCGPLIRKFKINDIMRVHDTLCEISTEDNVYAWGSNELEAICRAVIMSEIGNEVEL